MAEKGGRSWPIRSRAWGKALQGFQAKTVGFTRWGLRQWKGNAVRAGFEQQREGIMVHAGGRHRR